MYRDRTWQYCGIYGIGVVAYALCFDSGSFRLRLMWAMLWVTVVIADSVCNRVHVVRKNHAAVDHAQIQDLSASVLKRFSRDNENLPVIIFELGIKGSDASLNMREVRGAAMHA